MIEYFTPFKLFALWVLVIWLLARKIQNTPTPESDPRPQVDLKTVRETRRRELWARRAYNMRFAARWVRRD